MLSNYLHSTYVDFVMHKKAKVALEFGIQWFYLLKKCLSIIKGWTLGFEQASVYNLGSTMDLMTLLKLLINNTSVKSQQVFTMDLST